MHIHIEGTPQEVLEQMRAFLGQSTTAAAPATAAAPKAAKKTEASEPAKPAAPAAPATPAAPGAPTLDDIKAIIPKVMDKVGKPGIIALLAGPEGKFGAKKGSELKEEHYAEFMALATKALA